MHRIEMNVSTGEKTVIHYTPEEESAYRSALAAWDAGSNDRKAAEVRAERSTKLAASDWTQLPDVPQSIKSKWASYRQALRDVPQQAGFPFNVVWPT